MNSFLDKIKNEVTLAVEELISAADMKPGQILVVGCSTSEVQGEKIGSSGSVDLATCIFSELKQACDDGGIYLAVQCCEHLNRALVVERLVMEKYQLAEVLVIPIPKAGGALGACAMQQFSDPKVVEYIKADAGLDIGNTLIGMHLRHVAVPVRLAQKNIGQAMITAARTRPKLIGGARAVYVLPQGGK